ncbi:transglycosylase domain-containing protein [Microbacterium luticocti]|uniref:transglycosylase domain-containing protein n=1 Tax=Microbacterium luticocti TaxID=451764 RepID=UPI000429F076|nr:transglycosylase domain-containing protein [Microbacterium luticocti]
MPHSKRTAAGVAGGLLGLVGLSAVAGVLITATVTPAVAVTSAAATSAIDMFNNLPSVLTIDKLILPSTIYYKNDKGQYVGDATYLDQNRTPVKFDEIAPVMYDALLSSEDPRFYEHGGVDLIGTTRAILSNLKGGQTQGGSSISQQYVKNVLVQQCDWEATNDKELNDCWVKATDAEGVDGYQRKLQEMRYAITLEQRYSKDEILLGYMNIANFGGTTYGIEAAAQRYFGVHAKDLSLSQASALAGIVQNPNTYRLDMPGGTTTNSKGEAVNGKDDHYSLTKKRQEYVLDRMLADGKITQKQHDEAYKAPIVPKVTEVQTGCAKSFAPYFCAYVTATVLNEPAFGATTAEREQLLHRGGLKIYTTLDAKVQTAAQNAQNKYVPASVAGKNFGSTSVTIEASTGRVLSIAQNTKYVAAGKKKNGESAIVFAGSRDVGGSNGFNAGSTFKLFTLLDWLEKGHSLNQLVDGRNRVISTWKDDCVAGGTWTASADVKNFNRQRGYFGTPKQFTAQSLNTGFLGMAAQLDLCDIGKMAERLGVTRGDGSPIPLTSDGTSSDPTKNPAPYEVIGSDNVSPMAMAAAYATVANKGVYCQPRVIDKVTDSDGNELTVPEQDCKQVIDPKVAATAAYALQGVMKGGGSGAAGNPWDGTPLIGKTGTHEEFQTWLITSNTKVTTANWVGSVSGRIDLFHQYYKGNALSNLRYVLGRTIQGTVDKLYPGGQFPQPDSNLTRQVLVNLPNVVGMSVKDATSKLESAGFQVTVGSEVDSDQPKGTIAEQNPGAGRVAAGTNVTISPSNGKGISIPDVSGRAPDEAVAMLRASGFGSVDTQCVVTADGDGRVTGTDPGSGTVAGPNTKITVRYASPECGRGGGDRPDRPGKGNGRG